MTADSPLVAELERALVAGEAAAIALAVQLGADLLVIDERAGRAKAGRRSVVHVGTLGILLEAKRRHLLPAVGDAVDAMLRAGTRISDSAVVEALRLGGEWPRG